MPEEAEIKAKGALLVPLALIINSMKDTNWVGVAGVSEQDLKIVRKGILASQWYDRSLMERLATAVFIVTGQSKPEMAYQFGYGIMAETLLKVYRSPLTAHDPKEIMSKFADFYCGTWFNRAEARFTATGKGGVFKVTDPDGIPCQVCFVPMMRGVFARLVTENGGKNVKVVAEEEPLIHSQKITTLTLNVSWE